MKNLIYINVRRVLFLSLGITVFYSCERELSEDVQFATFPANGDIFTDDPVGLTDQFFDSFDPATGANPEGFDRDDEVAFEGSASIRIDVPAPDDPDGGFIGGIFLDRGDGRDLTGFDALTFYARGSTTATIGEVGFGTDFGENKFAVTANNIRLSTDWRKIIIPIPDPSKLVQERGMFFFSAGTQSTNGFGFTFWIDELRFEKLGTIAQSRPTIGNGEESMESVFIGSRIDLGNQITQTFNLGTGADITVNPSPLYFDFTSSDPTVAIVDSQGIVSVVNEGTSSISAQVAGVRASGTLSLNSLGAFPAAQAPTRDASTVISLFSDAYSNIPVRHYNGFFDGSSTQGGAGSDPNNVDIQAQLADGSADNIINYTQLNFVSIGVYETVPFINLSGMTHLHVDINVREAVDAGDSFILRIENGTGTGTISLGEFTINTTDLISMEWVSFDIELNDFAGLSDISQFGQLFFVTDGSISNIWVDNVYFYNE